MQLPEMFAILKHSFDFAANRALQTSGVSILGDLGPVDGAGVLSLLHERESAWYLLRLALRDLEDGDAAQKLQLHSVLESLPGVLHPKIHSILRSARQRQRFRCDSHRDYCPLLR